MQNGWNTSDNTSVCRWKNGKYCICDSMRFYHKTMMHKIAYGNSKRMEFERVTYFEDFTGSGQFTGQCKDRAVVRKSEWVSTYSNRWNGLVAELLTR